MDKLIVFAMVVAFSLGARVLYLKKIKAWWIFLYGWGASFLTAAGIVYAPYGSSSDWSSTGLIVFIGIFPVIVGLLLSAEAFADKNT